MRLGFRNFAQLAGRYIACFFVTTGFAQNPTLLINEITYTEPTIVDEDKEHHGWIELKNYSNTTVETGGLKLAMNDTASWAFPDIQIPPGGFIHVWLSGKNRTSVSNLHTSFAVENLRDNFFVLYDTLSSQTVDSIYVNSDQDWYESYARFKMSEWYHTTTRTPLAENFKYGVWSRVSSTTPFLPRDSAPTASVYYRDKFYILGGWTGSAIHPANKQVWVSDDLKSWKLIALTVPMKHNDAFYIVFNDKIWGYDGDAYSTTDGVHWTLEATGLPFGVANRITLFDGKLWVVHHRSIYVSSNGKDWTTVTSKAPWDARELPGFVAFKDKLWFFGGAKYHQSQNPAYTDIWSSSNGKDWRLETESPGWPGRAWFGSAVFDNKLWVYSGWDYYAQDDMNDVWYTDDGVHWIELKSPVRWAKRHAPYSWVARGALWICAGYYTIGLGLLNDVWKLEPIDEVKPNVYYLKNGADPILLSSWGNYPDGYGFGPQGFDFDHQQYVLANNTTIKLDSVEWNVQGYNSRVIAGNGADSIHLIIEQPAIVNFDLEQAARSQVTIKNNASPHVVQADSNSFTFIDVNEDHLLFATQLSNLHAEKGIITLRNETTITNKLEIHDAVFSGDNSFHYGDHASLIYKTQGRDHIIAAELSSDARPPRISIDCDCTLRAEKDILADTIEFKTGKFATYAILNAGGFKNTSDSTYVITENEGAVRLHVVDSAMFPVGTHESYAPIRIIPARPTDFNVSANPTVSDCVDYMLDVTWNVQPVDINVLYAADLNWDPANTGREFKGNSACIVTYSPTGHTTQCINDLNTITEGLTGTRQITVNDPSSPCILAFTSHDAERVNLFPNPTNGLLNFEVAENTLLAGTNIYDLNGRLVASPQPAFNQKKSVYEVNFSVPKGVYIVKVLTNHGTSVIRLVVN